MKTKTKFLALLSVLVLLLTSLFGLGVPLLARADGADAGEPERKHTSLYYFSDYDESGKWYNGGYLRDYINRNQDITYSEYHALEKDAWGQLHEMYLDGQMSFSDAFVIVEVRSGFPEEIISPFDESNPEHESQTDWIYEFLYDMFYELHEYQNCKIMFICGTDEARFESVNWRTGFRRNSFLEYVDIHVNTDLYTVYLYSAVMAMKENVNGSDRKEEDHADNWARSTIVLDNSMGSWYFFKRLIYCFMLSYNSERDFFPFSPEKVLEEMDVTVYFYKNGTYIDPYWGTGDIYKTWEEETNRGFIVAGEPTEMNAELWNLEETCYNGDATLYQFYEGAIDIDSVLPDIFYDFILDEYQLGDYNNWRGRSPVTCKPIELIENGWVQMPRYTGWISLIIDFSNTGGYPISEEDEKALTEFLQSSAPEFAQP